MVYNEPYAAHLEEEFKLVYDAYSWGELPPNKKRYPDRECGYTTKGGWGKPAQDIVCALYKHCWKVDYVAPVYEKKSDMKARLAREEEERLAKEEQSPKVKYMREDGTEAVEAIRNIGGFETVSAPVAGSVVTAVFETESVEPEKPAKARKPRTPRAKKVQEIVLSDDM
jgi:hypothetical protein